MQNSFLSVCRFAALDLVCRSVGACYFVQSRTSSLVGKCPGITPAYFALVSALDFFSYVSRRGRKMSFGLRFGKFFGTG